MPRVTWHILNLITLLCAATLSCPGRLLGAQPPTISVQPKNRTEVEGTNHTFSVTATGDAPLRYQWRFNGANVSGKTNDTFTLNNIQTNDAGAYQVVITNTFGAVTSLVATLTVRRTNDPVYSNPDGGWAYVYTGDAASNSLTATLDGTWNRQNGSDSWGGDARGVSSAPPGGVGTTNGFLTIEDAVNSGTTATDNRRFYFTHNLQQEIAVSNANTILNDGVTLSFRARLTPPPPLDPLTELTNAPNGYVNVLDGRGMFGVRQAGASGMIISFSLNQASEDTNAAGTALNFGQAGLHMNNLNGDSRSPSVDPGEGGTINLLPLDPTVFHEIWITIQDNGATAGTHRVSVYLDGSKVPTVFNVTAGIGSDAPFTNYLALGLPSTAQRGAYDIDFYAYKPGLITPAGFNDPVGIVLQPTDQFIPSGQAATFNVGATGTPPFAYQWYRNGTAITNATNSSYSTPPVTLSDDGSAFFVVVSNICNYVTSSPPAVLHLLQGPSITAQPQSLTVTNGDPASFSVTAQSPTAPSYQWRFNGANLINQTNSVLTIASASPTNEGNYDVVVTNSAGTVTSVVATLTVKVLDLGDAPAPYPTLLLNNGARHVIVSGIRLGSDVDIELDGQPNGSATGDDLTGTDDEDGVTFTTPLRVGQTASVQVVASTGGVLNAWMDFNGDGSWAESGDQIFTNQTLVAGTNQLNFLIRPSTTTTSSFARFRFSTAAGLSFNGPAADGEVEDYAVTFIPVADLGVATADSPDPVAINSNLVYAITVLNAGPSAAGVTLTNNLPGNITFVSAIPSQGSCLQSGGVVSCALGSLGSNTSALVTITIRPLAAGLFTNVASVTGTELDLVSGNNTAVAVTAVETPPSISAQPVSLTVTQGNTATFSVTAAGTAPLSYQWRFEGSNLSGQTNSTLVISNSQPSHAGTYTVRVTNRVGQIVSAPATLTVLVPPAITQQPQSRTNFAGSQASFSVVATGTAPLQFQWRFNSTNTLVNATNATLVLTNVQKTQTGDYTVRISNSAGAVTSAVARLTVFEMDFGDAPDPAYPTLAANNGARHVITGSLRLGSLLDFEPDGQPNAAATADDLNGVDDEDGVAFSTLLLVGRPANVIVIASAVGLLNAWIDFDANGSWAGAGEQIFTNRSLVAGTNSLPFVVPSTATAGSSYARFRVSSAGGLSFVGEAADGEVEDYAVSILPAVDLEIGLTDGPDPLILGSNLTYTITVTNRGPSAATGVILSNTLPSSANFQSATTTLGSCTHLGGIVTCSLGSLSAGGGAMVTIIVTPTSAGTITNTVRVSGNETDTNAANDSALATTTVMAYPVITSQPQSRTVTNGNNVSFSVTATGTALRYQWRFNGTNLLNQTNTSLLLTNVQAAQGGTYTVQVTNGVGNVLSDPAVLTVLGPAQIVTQPQSQTATVGSTVIFSVTATGSEPLSYQWQFNGSNLSGETAATLTISNVQPIHEGTYTVRVTNSAGTALSAPATLTVLETPVITQQPQSRTNFAGSVAILSVTAMGTEPLRYQWYLNQTNLLVTATNSTLTFSNAQKVQTGDYHVRVTNNAGAVTSVVARLTILEMDFGDAADIGYPTLAAFDGARHQIVPGIRLGATVDFEPDGQPNPAATGDDLQTDDEDGVTFTSLLFVGQTATVDVIASVSGFLNAWIDFNRNASWDDSGEQVFINRPLSAGTNHLTFSIPATAVATNTYARFRFNSVGGLSFDGAALDGEVEDYQVSIAPAIDLALTLVDNPDPVTVENPLTSTITVSNRGPSTATAVTVTHPVLSSVSLVSATPSRGSCSNEAGVVVCRLGPLGNGEQASIAIQLTPHTPGRLTNQASVAATELDINTANNATQQVTTVVALTGSFVNSGAIVIQDNGPATPYPSTILVSGLTAMVYKAVVTLSNLTHTFPADIDILLVGPGGQSVVLMSDAGPGRPGIANVVLSFDDDSSLIIPESGFFVSETYRPSNYGASADLFPPPAPAAPYGSQLSVFRDTDPNGIWSLYVVDDEVDDVGEIEDGWSLRFATLDPTADLAVSQLDIPDPVVVGSNLTYSIVVTNRGPAGATGVLLTNRLAGGLGVVSLNTSQGTCTNQGGIIKCDLGTLAKAASALVTIVTAPSAPGNVTNLAFVAGNQIDPNLANNVSAEVTTVKRVSDLSLLMSHAPEPVGLNQTVTFTLTVSNQGPNQVTAVTLTNILPGGISFVSANASQGSCANSGGVVSCGLGNLAIGAQAIVTITGTAGVVGTSTNRAQVTANESELNPANNSAVDIATVVVFSGPFANSSAITIQDISAAVPYPSSIFVSGVTAAIYQVSVTLSNLSHTVPDDLDILLVGPRGQSVLLMSDAGGNTAINNVTLKFEDAASVSLPDFGLITSGTFKPTAYDTNSDLFPLPAPSGPYGTNLAVFSGTDPNGVWSLYIRDDQAPGGGQLAGGWSLTIASVQLIADLSLGSSVSANPTATGSNLVYTLTITNRGPAPASQVTLTDSLPQGVSFVSVAINQGSCTNQGGFITCAAGTLAANSTVAAMVVVSPVTPGLLTNLASVSGLERDLNPSNNVVTIVTTVENPPVIVGQPQSRTVTNGGSVIFSVVATGPGPLFYAWQFNGVDIANATNATLTLNNVTPANAGNYRVRVSNRVATVLSQTAVLSLLSGPTISDIGDQTIDEDTPTGIISFQVQDGETPAAALMVSGTSTDTVLVPEGNIHFENNGTNRTVRIVPAPNRFGTNTITITVTDSDGLSASDTFLLRVISVNDVPVLSDINQQTMDEDTAHLVTFTIGDVETQSALLGVAASSSNPMLVPDGNLTLGSDGTNHHLRIVPATNQFGSALIAIAVSDPDGGSTNKVFLLTVRPVNDPPTLNPINSLVLEENPGEQEVLLSGITGGPTNENQTVTVTATSDRLQIVPNPQVIYVSALQTWMLRFTPLTNAHGTATITVTVDDGGDVNRTFSRPFTVTVRSMNNLPFISDIGDQITNEDTPTTAIPFIAGDVETNQANLNIVGSSSHPALVSNTNIVIGGSGMNRTVTITPNPNQFGQATITLTVTDADGGEAVDTFVLTVNSVNDAPTLATIDDVIMDEDAAPQTIVLSGISSGAANEDQLLTATASSSNPGVVAHPTIIYGSPNSTAKLILTPMPNASGSAVITVTVSEWQNQNYTTDRTFNVTVRSVNDLPVLSLIPNQATDEDTPRVIDFAVGDVETPAGALSPEGLSSNPALVPDANLVFGGNGSNRTLTITPVTNQSGSANITVRLTDTNGGVTLQSFVLTVIPVNDAPVITDIIDVTTAEDTPTGLIAFRVNDVETAAGSLVLSGHSSNPLLVPASNILFGGSGSNRTVNITPVANRTGLATITVTVRDADGATASDSFLLTVSGTNDPPVISNLADRTMEQNTSLSIAFTVYDPETPADVLQLTGHSSNPALVPETNLMFSGTGVNRTLTITPLTNQSGSATITVRVTDTNGASASDAFVLIVNEANLPPTLNTITNRVIGEDSGQQVVILSGIGPGTNEIQTVTLSAASSNPALILAPTISYTNPSPTGVLTFTPATNATGEATITVTVDDGQSANHTLARTFNVTVNPVNDAPAISAITNQLATEDTPLVIPFVIQDVDTPVLSLAVTGTSTNTALVANTNILFSGSGSNRTATIIPSANQSGNTRITLAVSDGALSNTTSFVLTVAAVNDPPTLDPVADIAKVEGPQSFTVNLSGITSGAPDENQTLTVSAVSSAPAAVAVQGVNYSSPSPTGSIDLNPANGAIGVVTITVTVSDGQTNGTFARSFNIYSRLSGNAVPTISAITNRITDEDTPTPAIPFTVSDSVTPAALLTPAGRSSNTNLVPNENIVFGGSGSNRTVTITPAANQFGTNTITISVTDTNFGLSSTSFLLTVNPVNDLPVISPISPQTTLEGVPAGPIPFTIGDVETAANSLAVTASSSNAALVPNTNILAGGSGTNRALLITPLAGQSGTANITVTVTDGNGGSTNRAFQLTVTPADRLPVISDVGNQTISEDTTTAAIDFTIGDLETPAALLNLTRSSSNQGLVPDGNILLAGSGSNRTVTVTPLQNQFGSTTITLTVTDTNGGAASDSFVLTVNPVNDPPTLDVITNQFLNEGGGPRIVTLTGITSGAANENQVLALSVTSSNPDLIPIPALDYVSANPTGTLTLVSLPGIPLGGSTATIVVTVNDGQNENNLLTRTFDVRVNAAPAISDIADRTIDEDSSTGPIDFTVSDLETAVSNLTVTATSSNPALVPIENISLSPGGTNRTVTVHPATNQFGNTTITLTVTDSDGNTGTDSFVLIVNAVNDRPTLDAITNVVRLEDATLQPVTLTGIGPGATNELQPLMVTAVSSDPSLVPHPAVNYTSPNSTGSLLLTSLPNANGTALITVTVNDGQNQNNSVTQEFTVTVDPVNDPPTLDPIESFAIQEDAGLQIVQLSGISVGAANEGETAIVTASSDNLSLIPNPNIIYTSPASVGTLRFTPVRKASGTATLLVTVLESRTSNSISRNFTVTVNAVDDLPTISDIADQIIDENSTTGPLAFTIGDVETNAAALTLSVHSSNPVLTPPGSIQFAGSGTTRSVTITPPTNHTGSATITVTVTDPQGNSSSDSFLLTVFTPGAPFIVSQPQSQIVTNGGTATFRVAAIGTPPLSYRWQRNGDDLPGETNAVLTIANVQLADEGDYFVSVSNPLGSTNSDLVRLRLSVSVSINITRMGNICTISFTTVSGFDYTLEYTDSLESPNPPTWIPIMTVPGSGNVVGVTNFAATDPRLFFRVRVD